MTYSLAGMTTLGTVHSEESTKDAQLFQMPMPASDSNMAIMLDLFGVNRTINIKGTFVDGDGSLTIAQFIAELDAQANGVQSGKNYVSGTSGVTYTILVQTASWDVEEGAPTKVNYTINMIEGSF